MEYDDEHSVSLQGGSTIVNIYFFRAEGLDGRMYPLESLEGTAMSISGYPEFDTTVELDRDESRKYNIDSDIIF